MNSVKLLIVWFFIFYHPNYARWVLIHLYDIINLPECHPDLFEIFKQGKFAVQKTTRRFSSIALYQAHEQVNCDIKCSGALLDFSLSCFEGVKMERNSMKSKIHTEQDSTNMSINLYAPLETRAILFFILRKMTTLLPSCTPDR